MITVITKECFMCGNSGNVSVPRSGYLAWDQGRGLFIQDAFPTVSADVREQLLTGTHGPCYDTMVNDLDFGE